MATVGKSYWSGGVQWGTAAEDGASAYWGPNPATPTDGPPDFWVAIGGRLVTSQLARASWKGGRSDWFAPLSPSTASLMFRTPPDAEPGEVVVIACSRLALWVGTVDEQTETELVSVPTGGQVTATDVIGALAQAKVTSQAIPTGTLHDQVEALTAAAGIPMSISVGPSDTALPDFAPLTPYTGSVLDYITLAEQTSNAILVLQSDGTFVALVRDALPDASVPMAPLVGHDSPSSWDTGKSATNVINTWKLQQSADLGSDVILSASDAASVALYGVRAYEVTDYRSEVATHYTAGLRTAMALPRRVLRSARFHIRDLAQAAIAFQGLDWIDRDGAPWQIMEVSHDVEPLRDDGGVLTHLWTVTIAADQTQSAIVGTDDPDVEEPPAEPEITTDTQVISVTRDAVAARTSGGDNYGSGEGDTLPVGRWDGWIFRVFLRWPITWPAGFISVKSAKVRIRTADQTEVAFGSSPKVYFQYVKESWTEGDEGSDGNYHFDNALIYPGPSRGSSGQVLKSVTRSENTDINVTITDIAQRWHDEGNDGVAIVSANESSQSNTTEFQSREGGFDAELTLVCYVEA